MEQNFDTGPGSRENANLTSQALLVAVVRFTASSWHLSPLENGFTGWIALNSMEWIELIVY